MKQIDTNKYITQEGVVYKDNKTTGLTIQKGSIIGGELCARIGVNYVSVAKLVVEHYKESVPDHYKIQHIDGNPLNCNIDNLHVVETPDIHKQFSIGTLRHRMVSNTIAIREDGELVDVNTNQLVTTYLTSTGYRGVTLRGKKYLVHRLVAEAFIANPDNLPVVDHINENKSDNRVRNLRWCTASQNTKFYYDVKEDRRIVQVTKKKDELSKINRELRKELSNVQKEKKELEKLYVKLEKQQAALAMQVEQFKILLRYKEAHETANQRLTTTQANAKPIYINGTKYDSISAAARYIQNTEGASGKAVQLNTVKKELRKYVNGVRPAWTMYGKYKID